MKATKYQKEIFMSTFCRYAAKFGMTDWDIEFKFKSLKCDYANIQLDYDNKFAVITMSNTVDSKFDPVTIGIHEALHLLMARLSSLAIERFTTYKKLDDAEEVIVKSLEKVIRGNHGN